MLNANVIIWRGEPWAIFPVGPTGSGGVAVPNRICCAPLGNDLRSLAGRPMDITPPTQSWETAGVEGLGVAAVYQDRLYLPYRASGKQGAFGIMEII
jgi:hypothetical protein